MKLSVLPFLACPRRDSGVRCAGPLSVSGDGVPASQPDPGDPDELVEGSLRCALCGAAYPVLSGVALLVPDPRGYLRRYRGALLRDLQRHGTLSPGARRWLERHREGADTADYGADFRFSQQFEDPWAVAQALTGEPEALYGPFARWLREISGQGPYDVLAGWAEEHVRERRFALDAGCGGGGLVHRLAPLFTVALGIDLSFLAVLLARRAVLHRPEPERSYFLPVRRGQEVERPLALPAAENAECVVADCGALPFPDGLFDAVCSSNVIDIAGLEPPLDEAARLLGPGGVLLLSDPYYFREREAPPGDPRDAVRAALAARGLTVAAERDGVPWAWATYDRHWRLYFNHCVAARRD